MGVDGNQAGSGAADSGAAYVFEKSGGAWTQTAYLKASNTGAADYFGISVAIDGSLIAVGAHVEDGSATGIDGVYNDSALDSGAAYTFWRGAAGWEHHAYLKASNTGASDRFGISVAVDGDRVLVGADSEDSDSIGPNGPNNNAGINTGAMYVFE